MGDTAKSIAESVYGHLVAKKPETLWLVGILSGIQRIQRENLITGFREWNLGDKEELVSAERAKT